MAMIPTPEANPEAKESGNLDNLSEQATKKKKAKEQPDQIRVENRYIQVGNKEGKYTGEWITGGAKKVDRPCGKGVFKNKDGVTLDGKWDKDGLFDGGKVSAYGRNYNITHVRVWLPNRDSESSFSGTGSVDGKNYGCTLDDNFRLAKLRYSGVDMNFTYENGFYYLKSSKGEKLALGNVDPDRAAIVICNAIADVKKHNHALDQFEDSPTGGALQADYEHEDWDTNIINDCYKKTGINAARLANWLNNCRHTDFGI